MKQNNIKIAVTGGIGSGKTTVCKFIKENGYPVFSCDEIYSELLDSGVLTAAIAGEFGSAVLTDEKVDRKKLSDCVFNDKGKLEKLNKITHKAIFDEMFFCAEKCEGVVFFEVPLLFEGGYQNLFDGVIVVMRTADERISSVVLRDGLSPNDVIKRIKKQFDYNNYDFAQYYVIHNSGNIDDLRHTTSEILLKITNEFTV